MYNNFNITFRKIGILFLDLIHISHFVQLTRRDNIIERCIYILYQILSLMFLYVRYIP